MAFVEEATPFRSPAAKPSLPQPALNSLINMPEKDVDSDIDRVDAMRILHTTHQLYGTGVSYGVLPHHGSLGRHRATQTRLLPPSHACLATPSARGEWACRKNSLGARL